MNPLCEAATDMKNGIFTDIQSKFSNAEEGCGVHLDPYASNIPKGEKLR
jgi:hypothetical protein